MRPIAVVCIVLAVLSGLSGINIIRQTDPAELNAGYVVGVFLLPVLFLIAGLKLSQKPKE